MDFRVEVERLDHATALDRPVEAVTGIVNRLLPKGELKDVLHGTWLGHPLHPLLTDLPIGTWTSALLLDWLGGADARGAADLAVRRRRSPDRGFRRWRRTAMPRRLLTDR